MNKALLLLPLLALTCPQALAYTPTPRSGAKQAASPVCNTQAEMLAYIQACMPSHPTRISLRYEGKLSKDILSRGITAISTLDGAFCKKCGYKGNQVHFDVVYDDFALMLGVHRGQLPASRLTSAQQRAYRKACAIVAAVRKQHRTEEALALALHDWIVFNSRYRKEVSADGSASSILLHGEGLCECYTDCFYLLATMAGLECRRIGGEADGTGHAWNQLRLNGVWTHVDCTFDDPTPDKPGQARHLYFGMSDAAISYDHVWDRSSSRPCPSDSQWYIRKHLPHFSTVSDMVASFKARGTSCMEGYVTELVRQPRRSTELLRAAVQKHQISLSIEYDNEHPAGSPAAGLLILRKN